METGSIKIYVRVKPNTQCETVSTSKDLHEVVLIDPLTKEQFNFDFYRVFTEEVSQEEVFETACKPLVDKIFDGKDACFLAYGSLDSGKSQTVFGSESRKGMLSFCCESVLEESERLKSQKDIRLSMSAIEIHGDVLRDLGVRDFHDLDSLVNMDLPLESFDGKNFANVTETELNSANSARRLLNRAFELRSKIESRIGDYSHRAHTFFIINVSQKFKTEDWGELTSNSLILAEIAGSENSRIKKGKDFADALNASSGLDALCRVFKSLNSLNIDFSQHKLTQLLKNACTDRGLVSFVANISPERNKFQETLETLNYSKECNPKPGNLVHKEPQDPSESLIASKIKKLQDERSELREKLRVIEHKHEEQMRKILEMLGIEGDIDSLLQASHGSKELSQIHAQKEAVQKISGLVKKNKELEKKIEENDKMFEHVKTLEYQNQENHLRKVLELKDELRSLQEELEITRSSWEHNQRDIIGTKSEELQRMLANSQLLVEEKLNIVQTLPKSMKPIGSLPDPSRIKELGKTQVQNEYKTKLAQQEKNHKQQIQNTKEQCQQVLEQKDQVLQELASNFKNSRKEKKQEISSLRKEMNNLLKIIKKQRKVLQNIKNGKYNQKLRPVHFPEELVPPMPSAETFPCLFKDTLFTDTQEVTFPKSVKQEEPQIVKVDLASLSPKDAKKKVEELRELHESLQEQLTKKTQEHSKLSDQHSLLLQQVKKAKEEKDRFQELYSKELNSRNQTAGLVERNKRILEKGVERPMSRGSIRSALMSRSSRR